ncbi:hypothetical protein ACIQ7Q_14300 [Streptomyces sp. NPDC096176]|uniref:hypothetical protein n=1 Tax=Streptomyces sp. NPDC096176 TaxID=3366079 RepID=UPI003823C45F
MAGGRLHDLRPLAATLSLLAGTGITVVQEKLGHSSRQITSVTYTSVLPEIMAWTAGCCRRAYYPQRPGPPAGLRSGVGRRREGASVH